MLGKRFGVLRLVFLVFLAMPSPVEADFHIEDDLQMWTPVILQLPLDEKLQLSFTTEPRLGDHITGIDQLVVHPQLDYAISKHVTAGVGYKWVTNYEPEFRGEHRALQHVTLRATLPNQLEISSRNQLEERVLEDTTGVAVRSRHMVRLEYPLQQSRWYLVGYDEVFVNLNSLNNGPRAGLDQNRLFAGLGRRMSEALRMEGGYQMQFLNGRGGALDQMRHILMVRTSYSL